MGQPVASGAMMMCSFGLAPSSLVVVPMGPPVLVEGVPMAVVNDSVPMMNVAPFGMCTSLANPTVAAATAAALGVLTPMPCIPATAGPWLPLAPTVLVGGKPVLMKDSMCLCSYGGAITVKMPMTVVTTVG